MIKALKAAHIKGLNILSPVDWNFDLEEFIEGYIKEDYYHAFVILQDEKIIGTGSVFFKGKIGWLANIIIAENYRSRGLGFKMTEHLVAFLKRKGCETQLLIATELGEPVYQKIGFKKTTDYLCFDTVVKNDFNYSSSIRGIEYSDLKSVYELDQFANGEDRTHLINRYYETGLVYFNADNHLLGFYLPDFGRGLVLSRDKKIGFELLKIKHVEVGRRSMIPVENIEGINFFEQAGLKKGRPSSRMILGKENHWNPKHIYSYGSGYCG